MERQTEKKRCQQLFYDFLLAQYKYSTYICVNALLYKGISANMNTTMIHTICEYLKTKPVEKAWIFGSFSRGEERPDSDIDILFVPDKSQHFSLFTLGGMYEDLKELLGREVDLITENSLMDFARESADKDKILIYERAN